MQKSHFFIPCCLAKFFSLRTQEVTDVLETEEVTDELVVCSILRSITLLVLYALVPTCVYACVRPVSVCAACISVCEACLSVLLRPCSLLSHLPPPLTFFLDSLNCFFFSASSVDKVRVGRLFGEESCVVVWPRGQRVHLL